MPWILSEETGCFSFAPPHFHSFPSLHPLFPSQLPLSAKRPRTNTLSFSLALSVTNCQHQHHYRSLTSLLTPTPFSRFLVLVCALPSSELFFFPSACKLGLSSSDFSSHSAVCMLSEDTFRINTSYLYMPVLPRCEEF